MSWLTTRSLYLRICKVRFLDARPHRGNEMIFYVGDLHGVLKDFKSIDRAAQRAGAKYIVQVGDLGLGFNGDNCDIVKYFQKRARQGKMTIPWITCGGNHDNYNLWYEKSIQQGNPDLIELAPGIHWAARGSLIDLDGISHLFCGGAESTDKYRRTEGVNWWKEETPNWTEFSLFATIMAERKPQVIVTHEAPLRVNLWRSGREDQPTPRNLESALKLSGHTPAKWFYGHHHIGDTHEIEGTTFKCCGLGGQYQIG